MKMSYSVVIACILVVVMQISAIPVPKVKIPQIPNTKGAEANGATIPVQIKVTPEEKELSELTKTEDKTLSRVPKVKSIHTEESNAAETALPQGSQQPEDKESEKDKDVDAKTQGKAMGRLPNLDLSPGAVAEYLMITGDFKGFETAVSDLVNSGVMTTEEAGLYKDRVGLELESLLQEAQNELLEDKVEDELETPKVQWPSYNWPMYDTPVQDFPGYDAPRPRRNMADDTRDQLILADLIDRVVAEYARAQEKAAFNDRMRENNAQAQTMLDMILNNQQQQRANEEPVYGTVVESPVPVDAAINPTDKTVQVTGTGSAPEKSKVKTQEQSAKPEEMPAIPPQLTPNKDVATPKQASDGQKLEAKAI